MIYLRKECGVTRRGLNLMLGPHYQAVFMWGTYNYRVRFGIGFSPRPVKRLYIIRNFWRKSDDLSCKIMQRQLYTKEKVDDLVDKKMIELTGSRVYTK